ncbi:MAG TPA: hypothetical protein VGO00_08610 [Kofleriaceae bacterium]|nr:hypothetical protein [Kofleriaceae bacterium]
MHADNRRSMHGVRVPIAGAAVDLVHLTEPANAIIGGVRAPDVERTHVRSRALAHNFDTAGSGSGSFSVFPDRCRVRIDLMP